MYHDADAQTAPGQRHEPKSKRSRRFGECKHCGQRISTNGAWFAKGWADTSVDVSQMLVCLSEESREASRKAKARRLGYFEEV